MFKQNSNESQLINYRASVNQNRKVLNDIGVIVDQEIQRIKPRPWKCKMTILWRRLINNET